MKPNTICVGRLKATETMEDFYCDHCCRQYEIENVETGEKSTITYSSSVETDGIDFTVKHDDEGWPYPEDIDATGCVEAELEEEDEDGRYWLWRFMIDWNEHPVALAVNADAISARNSSLA